MKRVATGLIYILLGIFPGVADDAVTISRALPTGRGNSVEKAVVESPEKTSTGARTSVASRRPVASTGTGTSSAVVSAPATASRAATISRVMSATSGGTSAPGRASRVAGNTNTVQSDREKVSAAAHTVGRNSRVTEASLNNTAAAKRAGVILRPTTAEVGGRATIRGTNIQTGSNIDSEVRRVQSRAATTAQTAETIAEAKERLEQMADLSNSCQQQYNDCMDQFCAVIDANQKRCSCSSNISSYARTESTVKEANTLLNDVAQQIRYVGLSADEIRAIMTATEAEQTLSGTRDTSQSRNMLEEIEEMIANPATVTSGSGTSSSISLDFDLDFSSGENMFSLDFLKDNSSGVSRKRGKELYTSAKKQCESVLNRCKSAGASPDQIIANYELAIDKDCIAYEQGLTKMNETLRSNVRSANVMLQKARLAVLNNKNQYDAKACVAALDTCMKDDMVCGEDYTKCLDPTKKYIDENGTVVLGENINDITQFTKYYDNTKIDRDFITKAMASGKAVSTDSCKPQTPAPDGTSSSGDGWCNVRYLMTKIGTGNTSKDGGLCRAVLDKCQRYTYDSEAYDPYNDIVVNYIQRALVNIRAAQFQIISDYASSCLSDLSKCYSNQVSQVNTWSASATADSIYKVMNGACRNVALTCAHAVFGDTTYKSGTETIRYCADDTAGTGCIENISEVFYQSLLCPTNSTYDQGGSSFISRNGTKTSDIEDPDAKAWANKHCYCNQGYTVYNGQCLICNTGYELDSTTGSCVQTK